MNLEDNIDHNYPYHINGVQLEQLDSIQDLGVNIDDKINKAYSFLGIIKRNFTYLDKDAFITLYKALVRSHVEYAVQFWSPYTVSYIKKIEKVQMRATKLITCINTSHMQKDLVYPTLPLPLTLPLIPTPYPTHAQVGLG